VVDSKDLYIMLHLTPFSQTRLGRSRFEVPCTWTPTLTSPQASMDSQSFVSERPLISRPLDRLSSEGCHPQLCLTRLYFGPPPIESFQPAGTGLASERVSE